jgi:hypothetical protein
MKNIFHPYRGLIVCALLLTGCASLADTSRQAVTTAVQVLSATAETMGKVDKDRQAQILKDAERCADATCFSEAQRQLEAWRDLRGKIVAAVEGVWDSVATLATGIPLYERGLKKDTDLTGWINDVWNSLKALRTLLDLANVPLGPLGAIGG